jgi:hypothetical protein
LPLSPAVPPEKIAPMPPRPLLVALAIAGVLGASREAAACDLFGPYFGTGPQLPLGCPVHVYRSPVAGPVGPLRISTLRAGAYVDVTGGVDRMDDGFTVERTLLDCQLHVLQRADEYEAYDHYTIQLVDVQVGEQIGAGTGWLNGIEIVPAGACAPTVQPRLACTDVPPCGLPPRFEDLEPGGGCAARRGGGLWFGLALLGLLRVCRCHRQ